MSVTQEAALGKAVAMSGGSGLGPWAKKHGFEIMLVLPLVAYVAILTVAPIVDTLRLSFAGRDGTAFPSIDNYRAIFTSSVFKQAVGNTIIVTLLSLTLELFVGLLVALSLNSKFRGQGLVRTTVLIPLGVPTIVSGAVMLIVFSRSGYLNSLLF